MTTPPHPTRRRALPLCLGLLATAAMTACDRRASTTNTPRDPGGTAPTTPPPDMPSSDPSTPSMPPASGPRP